MGRGAGRAETGTTRAVGALAAAGLAALALAGCGSSGGTDAASEPTDTTVATGTAASAWVAPTPAELGVEACATARAPVYVERGVYSQGTTTSGLRPPPDAAADPSSEPPADSELSLAARWYSGPRSPTDDSGVITVAHPTGEPTVLGGAGMVVGWPGGRTWIGDLDGDGVDEVLVISTRPGGDGGDGMPAVIVPGTVAPGLQDPFAVGIVLPVDGAQGQAVYGVGDIDGDGAEDVVVPSSSDPSSPVVVSGRALMAPGPGGLLAEVPEPIATTDPAWFGADAVGGLLTLSPGTDPVAGRLTAEGLSVSTEPATLLRVDDQLRSMAGTSTISAYRSGGHRIVVLHTDAGRSGVTLTQMWDLDGACPS